MIHGVGLLMISAAAGYWVLTLSVKEKGRVKTLGNVLGFLIIAISVLGSACKIYSLVNCSPYYGKGCPFIGKMAPASTTQMK